MLNWFASLSRPETMREAIARIAARYILIAGCIAFYIAYFAH